MLVGKDRSFPIDNMSALLAHTRLIIITLCSGLLIIGRGGTDARSSWPGERSALFIFGDSVYDAGTNNFINTTTIHQANFVPYGESFFKHPTGRFSDGRLIPDFIAEFSGLPLIPPYLKPGKFRFIGGVNFASGGAGALDETYQGFVVSLNTQKRQFEKLLKKLKRKLGDKAAEKTISGAVYMISIGSNDYLFPLGSNSSLFQSHSLEQYRSMVIGNLTTVIKKIHSNGGRKFGILNIGPLGCIPEIRALSGSTGSCSSDINEMLKLHNVALSKALEKLEKKLEGFKYSNFDFFNTTTERINDPSKYGFKDVKAACCGSGLFRGTDSCGGKGGATEYELCKVPSDHLFFDSVHPTERAYRQFAELMWSGSPLLTGPYNLKSLFRLS